jgi:SAM-dependent methyltransferase
MPKADYEWIAAGEEWSEPWGGSAAQWFGSILPRIHAGLPAENILEIGSGFGRWSFYLREHGAHLHLVDPDEQGMEFCRRRFGSDARISYHRNESDSLALIPEGSIDFIFSFDSLVHVRPETIDNYLAQFPAKLKTNGLAFIHHSNLGEFASSFARRARIFAGRKTIGADHQRDPGMTAGRFREHCERHGLKCVCQEIVNWRGRRLIDCFSTVALKESKWPSAGEPYRNSDFMCEAKLIRRRARHYPHGLKL